MLLDFAITLKPGENKRLRELEDESDEQEEVPKRKQDKEDKEDETLTYSIFITLNL